MGAPGRMTSLLKRSEVPLGEAVQAAIGRRAELPPVRAAPKAGAGYRRPGTGGNDDAVGARAQRRWRSVALARATARARTRRQARSSVGPAADAAREPEEETEEVKRGKA